MLIVFLFGCKGTAFLENSKRIYAEKHEMTRFLDLYHENGSFRFLLYYRMRMIRWLLLPLNSR